LKEDFYQSARMFAALREKSAVSRAPQMCSVERSSPSQLIGFGDPQGLRWLVGCRLEVIAIPP